MAKTVIIEKTGGPEVLTIADRPVGEPGPGEIRIRHKAVGLNFIDCYQRSGLYAMQLPSGLGREAAGVVEAVGEGVTHLKVGDRAAYAAAVTGAYCEAWVMPAAQVCPLPDGISFEEGAAMMLKGMTVEYLFHRTTPLKAGDTVLFHAAAGGVGLIACQWAKSEGITLIATAGSDAKCQLALEHGADHAINYNTEDFPARVMELTGGKGVDVVMDSVGASTWEGSLASLKPKPEGAKKRGSAWIILSIVIALVIVLLSNILKQFPTEPDRGRVARTARQIESGDSDSCIQLTTARHT